jgi:tripartite-type tricarboxylate transporter receptor subunit TctC
VAAVVAAKSAPDGYTIFFSTSTNMNTAQFLQKNLPFHPEKDFVPVVGLAQTKSILVARNGLGVDSVKDLVALARSRPGVLNYGSFGVASAAHMDAEAFSRAAGFKATHVPYKGGGPVMTGLLAGEVDFAMTALTAAIPLVRQGKLKGSRTGDHRVGALPQMPTLAEAGYGGFETGGMFAVRGRPELRAGDGENRRRCGPCAACINPRQVIFCQWNGGVSLARERRSSNACRVARGVCRPHQELLKLN